MHSCFCMHTEVLPGSHTGLVTLYSFVLCSIQHRTKAHIVPMEKAMPDLRFCRLEMVIFSCSHSEVKRNSMSRIFQHKNSIANSIEWCFRLTHLQESLFEHRSSVLFHKGTDCAFISNVLTAYEAWLQTDINVHVNGITADVYCK